MSIYSRTNTFLASIKRRSLLNAGGTKETYHLELGLERGPLDFTVGDSVAICPVNPPLLVESILQTLSLSGAEEVFDARSNQSHKIGDFLSTRANLSKCTSSFLKMLRDKGAKAAEEILFPENKGALLEFLQSHHLEDILRSFPGAHLSAQDLTSLLPLLPRFYSIASSPHMFPNEIHLTVASLTFVSHGKVRQGIGSHFLCHLASLHKTPIPLYVQKSDGFTLPLDKNAPIIMIGPGTGIAPFRAFLQERIALQHPGKNWLIFGERNRKTDFYYSDFFLELEKQNRLRLDLAFSRDQADKIYVQHRLWENRVSLFNWIQGGAYLYVCGDANNMAKDVDLCLLKIVCDQGSMKEEDGRLWLKQLRQTKRYLQDVY